MHWGGGSPNILEPSEIRRLASHIRSAFNLASDAEFAVEVDPRDMPPARVEAFAEAGVNRVSIGVQDFESCVQRAINREQTYETTASVVAAFRNNGIRSVNIDLVYGLPHQTRDSVERTIEQVLALEPDRIALFGYAHLPQRLPHQRLIDASALPDAVERFAQANRAANRIMKAGYVRVGLDHFAKPGDSLATGHVHRNFQGYTPDDAGVLLGLGASAIGRLKQGYVQNAPATAEYERLVLEHGLATVRGHRMSLEDEARALVIKRLMCDLRFPARELTTRFGPVAAPILEDARDLISCDSDGLVEEIGDDGEFQVTEKGRLFVRSICSVFDSYLGKSNVRYAQGV
jgi:oxygen-independent coproporphyrinogen-3 oxidase